MSDHFSSNSARTEIYQELAAIRLIDPHTHINPLRPASSTLADILGYHYYTELAHSAGMEKSRIEDPSLTPKELVGRLVEGLGPLENTAQYHWLIEICKKFFGFEEDRLHAGNWESLYDRSETTMASAQWAQSVLDQSNVQAVFLTNDFDDDLEGFDSQTYIPCLRTDDLVFHIADPKVRGRLLGCTQIDLSGSLVSLRDSLQQRFDHFVNGGARACAISLPPSFSPQPVSDGRAQTALDAILRDGLSADQSHRDALARRIFWTLAELCDEYGLPFDLMIGVNRGVYPGGVHQGRDLFDSRVSLIQYRELFNSFPNVKFPVSVLASVTNQELASYAWIFPNVITNGHWWYSNTPSTIAHDAALRLEAVPQTKQIGYYSDAYKLEFVWPKFDMYRQVLAGVLAEQFVSGRGWSVERAVDLGRRVLRDNVETIFPEPPLPPAFESQSSEDRSSLDSPANLQYEDMAGVVPGLALAAASVAELNDADSELAMTMDISEIEEVGEVPDTYQTLIEDEEDPDAISDSTLIIEPTPNSIPTLPPAMFGIRETENVDADGEWPELMDVDELDSLDDLSDVEAEGLSEDETEGLGVVEFQEPTHASAATVMEEEPESLTVIEAFDDDHDGLGSGATSMFDDDVSLSDLPTLMEDPLPKDEEIGELELMDVEFVDVSDDMTLDVDQIDQEPLDVGNLTDDSSDELVEHSPLPPQIEQLTGEGSFSPDEDTFQLHADPQTGEYTLPTEQPEDDDDDEFDLLSFDDDGKSS